MKAYVFHLWWKYCSRGSEGAAQIPYSFYLETIYLDDELSSVSSDEEAIDHLKETRMMLDRSQIKLHMVMKIFSIGE